MGEVRSSIPMASRDRDRELLVPVADSVEDGESKPSSSSSSASSHHSGREVRFHIAILCCRFFLLRILAISCLNGLFSQNNLIDLMGFLKIPFFDLGFCWFDWFLVEPFVVVVVVFSFVFPVLVVWVTMSWVFFLKKPFAGLDGFSQNSFFFLDVGFCWFDCFLQNPLVFLCQ